MTGVEVLVVLGASLVGAFVKSVTGMGYPLFAIPIITLVIGIEDAIVIVAAPNMAANLALCWGARDGRDEARDVRALVLSGLAGAAVGTFLLVQAPEEPLQILLAATIVGYVVVFVRSPDLRIDPETSRRWAPAVGAAAGVMQGAVGVSGPVVATWLHGYRLPRQAYVFSVTAIFFASGSVQFWLLLAAGEVTAARAAMAALAAVPVFAMIPVGSRLRRRLGGRGFDRAVLLVLVVSGFALLVEVVF